MGVWIEGRRVPALTTESGYCHAACHVQGPEVVVLPRYDLPEPYSPAQVDAILRKARKLTGAAPRPTDQPRGTGRSGRRFSPDGRTAAALVAVADTPR